MSSARDEVLSRIRRALADRPAAPEVPRAYRRAGDLDQAARLDLLVDRLVDYKAAVRRCPPPQLPDALMDALSARGAARIVVPPGLPWDLPGAVADDGLT
ncbi:MAG TPA: lactate utilization protein C, partial [Mycobacteriales bacterium]|nr:lactate utilization protein C [Mycobacteriales bacterium]